MAAVERATERQAVSAGKPEPYMYRALLRGLPEDATPVVIGDNLATDIRAGRAAGFTTILVLSGIATREAAAQAAPEERPDSVAADLPAAVADVLPRLARAG